MGIRGIIQNSVQFDGVRVTRDQMLGEPGQSMRVVEDVLSHGRLATAAVALGAAQRSAQLILRYTSRREIDTGLLLDNPQAGVEISEMMHRIAIGREMLAYIAAKMDAGDALVAEVAMAVKVAATDTGNFAANLLMQLLGGRGYMENNLAPQIFRDTRMLSIGEGANESLVAAIGRSVRMNDSVQTFLAAHPQGQDLAEQIVAISRILDGQPDASPYTGSVARTWLDSVRGRLAVAALELAHAKELEAPETREWSRQRFEEICREAQDGSKRAAVALTPSVLRGQIDSLRKWIGDTEASAPDVDLELDLLLRRDVTPEQSPVQKKELLRKLLTLKTTPIGGKA